jgi:hypothetical protein
MRGMTEERLHVRHAANDETGAEAAKENASYKPEHGVSRVKAIDTLCGRQQGYPSDSWRSMDEEDTGALAAAGEAAITSAAGMETPETA